MWHLALGLLAMTLLSLFGSDDVAQPNARALRAPDDAPTMRSGPGEGERAFDFLIGEWTVKHRRRTQILKGSEAWTEFDGSLVARKIWDGRGHIDEFRGNAPTGLIQGMSVRLYDPASNQWRDYFTNDAKRILDPPVVGAFKNGRAEFFSHELFDGRSIFVRQLWTSQSPTACRWEQAFSADGGQTWETNWIMDLTRTAPTTESQPPHADPLPVVELRQYTLLPGKRDVLIELFEREFIEGQEVTGMSILGQFRDLDRPDRFVWIRAFKDMPTRGQSLEAFYSGPVWQANRNVANGTMVDSHNVLLLRPARTSSGFTFDPARRAPRGATAAPATAVMGAIYPFKSGGDTAFVDFFEHQLRPALEHAGGRVLGYFVTDPTPNNFPKLPLREGEHDFVWFVEFETEARMNAAATDPAVQKATGEAAGMLSGNPQLLRLRPTVRSVLGR